MTYSLFVQKAGSTSPRPIVKGASPARPQLSKAVSFEDGQVPDKSVPVLPRSKLTTAPLPKRHDSDSDDNKDDDWSLVTYTRLHLPAFSCMFAGPTTRLR